MRMKKSLLAGLMALALVSTVSAAQDVDNDGLYEDVNGDGAFNIQDPVALFDMINENDVTDERFDFNEDGNIALTDVQALYQEGGFETGELSSSQDIDEDGLNEDINGDGTLTQEDVEIFFDNFEGSSAEVYDFNQDGGVDIVDVQKLYTETAVKTSPSVGNVTPENNSVIETDYGNLDQSEVTLSVSSEDPAGGDVNVTFYNGEDAELGTDTSSESNFTYSWDVDNFREYEWYAEAEDSNSNITETDVHSFEVSNSDTSPPSITFTERPSDTTNDRSVDVGGYTNEVAKIEYRVDGGEYRDVGSSGWKENFDFRIEDLDEGEHTVTVRAEDRSGNSNTSSFEFEVTGASDINFQVNVDKSYPQSGIPIDPDSQYEAYMPDDIDFDFTLERNGNVYDISNGYQDGICNFEGDNGWDLGGDQFCGTEVPQDITTGVNYDLVVEWEGAWGQDYRRVIDDSFPIEEATNWYSNPMSHGGRIADGEEVSYGTKIDGESTQYNGQTVTCTGSSYEVTGIGNVESRCSNGATSDNTVPVASFMTRNGEEYNTNNNDMFGDSDCTIDVSRATLYDLTGGHTGEGYRPENCNLGWTLGGDSSFTAGVFSAAGEYSVTLDYVNAVSNSPDYICPADPKENNPICASGSIPAGTPGWKELHSETVQVVDPEGNVVETTFTNANTYTDDSGETFVKRKGYSGDITGTTRFKNTGSGIIEYTDLEFSCPSNVECTIVDDPSLEVEPGETIQIGWKVSPEERTTGSIDVTMSYDDVYGLQCAGGNTGDNSWETTMEFTLDEENPETEEVN